MHKMALLVLALLVAALSTTATSVNVVHIQDKEPTERLLEADPELQTAQEHWIRSAAGHDYNKKPGTALSYYGNSDINIAAYDNAFFSAFLQAYNNHGDIVLSPDDVWLTISLQFAKYINDNAEAMRHMFVDHEGKKTLAITTRNELSESQWDEFFSLVIEAIRKNVKGDVVNTLESKFSTTGLVEHTLSVATIMDSFKQYFEYVRMIPGCGIANVHFLGTLEDWTNLVAKLKGLQSYDVDGKWKRYVTELVPVLEKFVDTYQNNVDVDFWNRVMQIEYVERGSSGSSYVNGWILKFLGIYHRIEVDEIKDYKVNVPVKIMNENTMTEKDVSIVGGFGGVLKKGSAYRPQQSLIVYDGSNGRRMAPDAFSKIYSACARGEAHCEGDL